MILLLSLFSPIAELFPNLYMSWWLPSNGNIGSYLKYWPFRIITVLTVWVPILITIGLITSLSIQLFISVLVFSAFGARLFLFDRALHKNIEITEENKPSSLPEILYFIAFSTIGWVLFNSVPSSAFLVPLGIGAIFLGANFMGHFRNGPNKNINYDIVGRIIFTLGFLLNLYNLARAGLII